MVREIRRRPLPGHIGIILDGNRRYARERGLADPGLAYGLGAEKLDDVLAWCVEVGIPTLSLWVLSTENLGGNQAEARRRGLIPDLPGPMGKDGGETAGGGGEQR